MIRIDAELAMPSISPVCTWCCHLRDYGVDHQCDAFPNGIPMEIWKGQNDHREPFPGDGGIVFEPIDVPSKQRSA
jgi:hypothetical protein